MIKEIKYNGYTSVPADYECPDGDLAGVVNMLPDEYGLTPIYPPKKRLGLEKGYNVVYVHKSQSGLYNYIIRNENNTFYYITKAAVDRGEKEGCYIRSFDDMEIHQINAIGNTLLILTSEGVQYLLWKGEDKGGYKYLGSHLPECPISFGLQGDMKRSEEFDMRRVDNTDINGYEIKWVDWSSDFPHLPIVRNYMGIDFIEENKKVFTPQVLARVNEFITDEVTNKGRFIFPFLVRYAYRLYDGTLSMHSAPVLMIANTSAPVVTIKTYDTNDEGTSILQFKQLRVVAMVHQLDYAVKDQSVINSLKEWSDIIKSVDIFISKPVYTYDQNGYVKKVDLWKRTNEYTVGKNNNIVPSKNSYYTYQSLHWVYGSTFPTQKASGTSYEYPSTIMVLPQKDTKDVMETIRSESLFYFLKSINTEDLKTERTIIDVSNEYLPSLVNREVMTDDYDSHDKLLPTYSYVYNSKLNICNLRKTIFKGWDVSSMFGYTDEYMDDNKEKPLSSANVTVDFYLRRDGRDIIVRCTAAMYAYSTPFIYLYFPDASAYKAVIYSEYNHRKKEVSLAPHNTLNGAVYVGEWADVTLNESGSKPKNVSSAEERTVEISNKIYTSEINNPFYFPLTGINTVGAGKVYAVISAAKAVSEGQFGQYPLYAFTDEGVWALAVSTTGGYSNIQPFTRDVCLSPQSITQLDSSVVFVSARGIVQVSGSQTAILTDTLKLEKLFDLTTLPGIKEVAALSQIQSEDIKYDELSKYLPGCRIIYAYVPQRLIVYNPKYPYAYVYSWKTKQWGLMHTNVKSHINSYPEALAMNAMNDGNENDGNELVDFCENATTDDSGATIKGIKGIVLTRPLKLDNPDVLKTVDVMIQRGTFKKGHVKTVLYGSRDLNEWFMVWTSQDHYLRGFRGTPYKYFRVALICDLEEQESVYGATVQYTPRLTDQPR